ncbi:DUF973 family protein [Pyrobaculum neutrophilum]|uniref:Uncharacterized protein n=1 Tax=Pyrobaculum neutrophilum (strain DSM 2338 / JCM 9278 / NBRC 100436 / V24Sta) TaxID=444157 RepID=B1YC75_PYRNV|nr:DUF973 family protein [Pyrobaculum neutrophilum]ACB39388.1 protein of unknown function DUF973 [Pyrobaculum neutrophilum V24Sta]
MAAGLEGLRLLRSGIQYLIISVVLSLVLWLLGPVFGLIAAVAAFVLAILGFVKIWRGFTALESVVGSTTLGKVGVILIVTVILAIVGVVLLGIQLYKIGAHFNEGTLKAGGIVTAIPLISFIGLILAYVGLGNLLSSQTAKA